MTAQTQERETTTPQSSPSLRRIIAKFLLMWFSFVLILIGVALITNVDWARRQVQEKLTEIFHRNVRVGHIWWHLGLNGLSVGSNKLKVYGADGKPFLISDKAEVGIAFRALVQGKLIIKHIALDKPELWAVKEGKNKWNFDDLLTPGLIIEYVETKEGLVHVRDGQGAKPAFEPFDVNDLDMKLVWPSKKKKRPFYLSFELPKAKESKKPTATFELLGIGVGELSEDWKHNDYQFDVTVKRFDPSDLDWLVHVFDVPRDILPPQSQLPTVNGLVDMKVKGAGTLAKGIEGSLNSTIANPKVKAPFFREIDATEAVTSGKFVVSEKDVNWKELDLRIGDIELKSEGKVLGWGETKRQYIVNLDAEFKDLGTLGKLLEPLSPEVRNKSGLSLSPEQLNGRASIQVQINGSSNQNKISAIMKAEDVSLKDVISELAPDSAPLLALLGLSSTSKMNADIKLSPNERIDIKNAKVQATGTVLNVDGYADLKNNVSMFKLIANDLSLKAACDSLTQEAKSFQQLTKYVTLPSKNSLSMSGKVNLNATITSKGASNAVIGTADMRDAGIHLNDRTLSANKINGRVEFSERFMQFNNLTGTMGDGTFQLNGRIFLKGDPELDIKMHATKLDLAHLSDLMYMFKIQIPIFKEKHLYGRVKDFSLTVTGRASAPVIAMTTYPDNLYYQPPGTSRALKGISGSIIYEHDQLELKEVTLVSKNNQLVTSLAIDNLSKTADLRRVKIKTVGVDITEVNYYLESPVLPPPLRKAYKRFLATYQLKDLYGRLYGDILCQLTGPKVELDGVIGCFNAGAKVAGYPVDKVAGIFAASGDELLIQDLSGSLRKQTNFVLDGHVSNYKSDKPSWKVDLRTRIGPQELVELSPKLTELLDKDKIEVHSSGPLSIKAKIEGNADRNAITFSAVAAKADALRISGPFGQLHQPLNEPLTVDGSVIVDKYGMNVKDSHVLLGSSVIQAQGSWVWDQSQSLESSNADTHKTHGAKISIGQNDSNVDAGKVMVETIKATAAASKGSETGKVAVEVQKPQHIDFKIRTPNPVSAKSVVAVLDPETAKGLTAGTVFADLSIKGNPERPVITGEARFEHLTSPSMNLKDLTGKIVAAEGKVATPEGLPQQIALTVDKFTIMALDVTDAQANISFEPISSTQKYPLVKLNQATAKVADGKISLDGWYDSANRKTYVKAALDGLKADTVATKLLSQPGEITGTLSGEVSLQTSGADYQDLVSNLNGTGNIVIANGRVSRFGQLQTKLTQFNFLTQGILGFNLNNLLQSMVPVRTGEFKQTTVKLQIAEGVIGFKELRYSGDDMRLWGAGNINVPLKTVDMEIAGSIPRVSSSFLSGSFGEVSRAFTFQKLLSLVTFKKLDTLPGLPILGEIATDRPRTFSFKVISKVDDAKMLQQSIEKSFKWLPPKPNASAHPIPGM